MRDEYIKRYGWPENWETDDYWALWQQCWMLAAHDEFSIMLITNAYEKGVGCGRGDTDGGRDLRDMYGDKGGVEQQAYIMGFEEGQTQKEK